MIEATILARAVAGDREAYAELVSQYYPSCMRVATRMLRNRADAEDVVQETFLRALRALSSYDQEVPFRAWLFRILLNRCHTVALSRTRRERRFVSDDVALHTAAAKPDAVPDNEAGVIAAVEELEPKLREAFLLKYVEEMEYTEMARITGASISALKMRVKRACEALRPRLEGVFHEYD